MDLELGNSNQLLLIAVLTGILGTIFAYFLGYLSVRKSGRAGKIINLLSISTIAIPGLVWALVYALFKGTNGFLRDNSYIGFRQCISFFGFAIYHGKNCLTKINKDYEVIGETLGISKFKILVSVLILIQLRL